MAKPEILNLPPAGAVRHFRAKGYLAGFDWRDIADAEHVRHFTVAKAMRLDILEDVQKAMDTVITEGLTFEWFQDELEPILRRKGWWGRQAMTDPLTGERRIVQLGSARRLRTIFDTNLRMAHAHGRWQWIQRLKDRMPYLRYVAVLDGRTRPEHMAWHGTVLHADHPWFRTHYPPNGFHCRCIVQQLGEDDLKRFGYRVSDGPPPGSELTRPWLDKRNGRIVQVPAGIDPGFVHNVGTVDLGKDAADRLIGKIDAAPDALARTAIGQPWATPLFRRHLSGASGGDWPVAVLSAAVLNAIGGKSKTVRLSGETAAKQTVNHHDLEAKDYARVQRIFDGGELFAEHGTRAIGFLEEDGRLWRAVVKAMKDGRETYLATLHKAQPNDVVTTRRRLKKIDHEGE